MSESGSFDAVEALGMRLARDLAAGRVDAAPFRFAGAQNPERAAAALRAAIRHPDLSESPGKWAPALLASSDPEKGADALARLAVEARAAGSPLLLRESPLLPLVLGSSPFLARLLRRHPLWWSELRGSPPAAPRPERPADWDAIRAGKYRGLLRIVARDFAGRPFRESLYELSDLADVCLTGALELAAEEQNAPAPALLALGKLGGRELNFSSDVDLLFLEDAKHGQEPGMVHERATRVVRRFKQGLEERTADGFGYRVDLDLRPEGRAGVLTNSVDAALAYYEAYGAEWERQMLIRLRPIESGGTLGARFSEEVRPFVYRRSFDPGALGRVRGMKERIESERREAGKDLDADLKEGPGGIRDVEFLVQALQLFHGGRHESLRSGNVLETLDSLGQLELLPPDAVTSLAESYLWLRRAEHGVQLPEERQTARMPRDSAEQLALARRMAHPEASGDQARAALLSDWTRVRETVRQHFDALVLEPSG